MSKIFHVNLKCSSSFVLEKKIVRIFKRFGFYTFPCMKNWLEQSHLLNMESSDIPEKDVIIIQNLEKIVMSLLEFLN
jgi:hypothetical protein